MKFDVVVIGGGWAGRTVADRLAGAGLRVCVVSEGLSLAAVHDESPYSCLAGLQKKGVTVLRGDRALQGRADADKVTGLELALNLRFLASFRSVLAAGMEGAARWRIHGRRHVPIQHDALLFRLEDRNRHGAEQRLGQNAQRQETESAGDAGQQAE